MKLELSSMLAFQAQVKSEPEVSEGKARISIKSKRSLSRQDALEADEPPTNCDDDGGIKIGIDIESQGEALNDNSDNNDNNNNSSRSSSDNSNNLSNFIIDDKSEKTFEDAKDTSSSFRQSHPCVEHSITSLEHGGETCIPSKLHLFSKEGNLEMVRVLLSSGADVNCVYRDGNTRAITPLNLSVRKRRHDVALQLLAAGAKVDAYEEALSRRENIWMDSYSPLHWAVENGDVAMVELLLIHGADRNKRASLQDHQFVTPLHLAAQDGNTSICRLLLSHPECLRDPVKITPKRNMITPLHQAAFNGHTQTVRLLLDMGCDPNKQADNGYAALHYACQIGDPEMVRMILSHGGRHDLKSFTEVQSFITPLHLAVQSADEPTIRLLAGYGADLEAEKRLGKIGGMTPLHQAVYQNKLKIVKLLIDLGANVHSKSGGTWYTVCHIAAEKGHLDMIDLLLSTEVRADINAKAALGEHKDVSPLHVASQFGHNGIIKKLVKAGADINCVRRFGDRSGMTCLHLAVEFGHADTVQLLTNLGCNVNAVDSLKYSPLHTAVQHCRLDMVKLLLACNKCNLKLKNISGLTPKQLAKKTSSSVEIAALFRENQSSGLRKIAKSRRSKSAVFKYLCGL